MKQVIKKVRVSLLVIVLSMVFVLVWNNNNNNNNNNSNVLFATAQMTDAPTFSVKGTMLPLTVTNTGKQLLTNIVINYGGDGGGGINSKNIEKIDSLASGAKIILSPPENSLLESVTVTAADQDISMTKDYRTPIKIPGMMGS
jgi:hypothetical protein